MKDRIRIVVTALVCLVVLLTTIVIASDEQGKDEGKTKGRSRGRSSSVLRPGPVGPGGETQERPGRSRRFVSASRRRYLDMINGKIEERQKEHEIAISEIRAIQKMALEENAPKTAQMLEGLIGKKEKEFKKSIQSLIEQRDKMKEQLQLRMQRRQSREEIKTSADPNE